MTSSLSSARWPCVWPSILMLSIVKRGWLSGVGRLVQFFPGGEKVFVRHAGNGLRPALRIEQDVCVGTDVLDGTSWVRRFAGLCGGRRLPVLLRLLGEQVSDDRVSNSNAANSAPMPSRTSRRLCVRGPIVVAR